MFDGCQSTQRLEARRAPLVASPAAALGIHIHKRKPGGGCELGACTLGIVDESPLALTAPTESGNRNYTPPREEEHPPSNWGSGDGRA